MRIDLEHPEHMAQRAMWARHRDLYVGGEPLKANAAQYLERRQKEPGDVYAERLGRVFYENYIGSIIDWYAATLFRREPVLLLKTDDPAAKRFLNAFADDCDLKGTSLTDYYRRHFISMLVNGVAYTLVDLPRTGTEAASRAEEEATGSARAYLVSYGPEQLTNWSTDDRGHLESAVLRTTYLRAEEDRWVPETQWRYYDRERFEVHVRRGEQGELRVIDGGRHALAHCGRVPLVESRLPEGLWLMNKAGLLQLEHFNKSNALSWALAMGLFAMPVIYSEREWDQMVGESYYIQLGPQDRFGWTEPDGKVYQIAAENLQRLQQEIYRVCFLMQQAGSATGAVQSGLSKQRDYAVTQEVLRAYGDTVKESMRRTLQAVCTARGDEVELAVSGLDQFDIGDFRAELEDAEYLLRLGIASPTLRTEVHQRLAQKYLGDAPQRVKDQIAREIAAGTGGH